MHVQRFFVGVEIGKPNWGKKCSSPFLFLFLRSCLKLSSAFFKVLIWMAYEDVHLSRSFNYFALYCTANTLFKGRVLGFSITKFTVIVGKKTKTEIVFTFTLDNYC